MVSASQLLPPNAMPLERSIADTAPRQRLDSLAEAPRQLKSAPPAAVVPWLAAEWFLADFIGYFPDTRALVAAGLPWLKVRGTAAAVKQALAWIGMHSSLEEDGARLQLDPGSASAPENLAAIKQLVGASIPAHVQLYRLHHGYDRRVLHGSSGERWSEAFLSDDSGVWIDGVKLSFGRVQRSSGQRPASNGLTCLSRRHVARALYPDISRWGTMHFGDLPVRNYPVMHGRLIGLGNPVALRNPAVLAGKSPLADWDDSWNEGAWNRWQVMTPHRRIARAALPLSEDARLGQPNSRFGGYSETAERRFFWSDSDSLLSAFDPGRIRIPIDVVEVLTHPLVATAPTDFGTAGPAIGWQRRHSSIADWRGQVRMDGSLRWSAARLYESTGEHAIARLHTAHAQRNGDLSSRYGWSGAWNDRHWGGDLALTHQTLS
jgi:hypothetical protein